MNSPRWQPGVAKKLTSSTQYARAGHGGRIYMKAGNFLSAYRTRFKAGDGGNCYGQNLHQRGGSASGDIILLARYKRLRHVWLSAGRGGTNCEPGGWNGRDGIIFIDPSDVSISGEDTIIEGGNVTIAGGDNGTIELTELNEGAITATGDLTVAVGEDGVIMTDSTDNILKADGQVNLFADDIMLPEEADVSDITGDNVVIGSGQIARDVSLMASGNSSGEAGITLPFEVTLSNNGPKSDTYLLTVTDEEGWSLSQLPSSLEIEGHGTTELTLNVLLPSTREATNVITVTAISQSDPTVVTTTEINVMVTEKESDSVAVNVSINRCPSSGIIDRMCKNNTQVLTDVTLNANANVSHSTFAGVVQNNGIISQSTVQTGAVITGGEYTGYITNEGTLTDFVFVGAEIKGGKLAGKVRNNSQVGGVFVNVRLAANTSIDGGAVQGEISGNPEGPALLKNLKVRKGSRLINVIIGENVELDDDVELGEGVRFRHSEQIPDGELIGLLPTLLAGTLNGIDYPRRADFSADIFDPSEGILSAINALPDFKDNAWVIRQNAELSHFELTLDQIRFALLPVSVKKATTSAGLKVQDAQRVQFITDSGLEVLTHPALQMPSALLSALSQFSLTEFTVQTNGNLHIPDTGGQWFSARPDWLSVELESETEMGIRFGESPLVSGQILTDLVFSDEEGGLRQQILYPGVAQPNVLYSSAKAVQIEPFGLINFKLGGKTYRGVVDYLVTQGESTTASALQVKSIPDANGDGIGDVMLLYPNGEQQKLFVIE